MKVTRIHELKNEDDEREFWAGTDSTKYVDWASAKRVKFVRLKLSLKKTTLRLPVRRPE